MFITIPANAIHNKISINTDNIAYIRHADDGIVHVVFSNSLIVRLSTSEYEQYIMPIVESVTHVTGDTHE